MENRANNTSLVLSMDNSLDLQSIHGQSEEIAQRDKVEADLLNQTKVGLRYRLRVSLGVRDAVPARQL